MRYLKWIKDWMGHHLISGKTGWLTALLLPLVIIGITASSKLFFFREAILSAESKGELWRLIIISEAIPTVIVYILLVVFFLIMFRQISKRREVEENNAVIMENLEEGVVVMDSDLEITHINEAAEEMLSWREEEVVGKNARKIMVLEDEEGNKLRGKEHPFRRVTESRDTVIIGTTKDYYIARKTQRLFPAHLIAAPITLSDGGIGVAAVFRDISVLKELEVAKTEFVSLASHQLRTPPTTVNWNSELLLSGDLGELNERQREFVEDINASGHRMVKIVNSFLNVSRIELGTLALGYEKGVSAKDILETSLALFDKNIEKKELKVERYYPEEDIELESDPELLDIVLQTLISNAVRYTPKGGTIALRIETIKNNENNDVVFHVIDTGVGIPEDEQDRVFVKMFRASNAQVADPGGTGLGLYIARSVVELLDGRIWFESSEGDGTTFSVAIPKEKPEGRESSREGKKLAPFEGKI